MADQKLLDGVRLFRKKDSQPDFVLASGVITPNKLVAFLKENPDLLSEYQGEKQVRIQVLKSKDGNPYIAVDTWKPNTETTVAAAPYTPPAEVPDDQLNDLPF
jgi:hypothetical protein